MFDFPTYYGTHMLYMLTAFLFTLMPSTHTRASMRACFTSTEWVVVVYRKPFHRLLLGWLDATHCKTSNLGHGERHSGRGVHLQCEL